LHVYKSAATATIKIDSSNSNTNLQFAEAGTVQWHFYHKQSTGDFVIRDAVNSLDIISILDNNYRIVLGEGAEADTSMKYDGSGADYYIANQDSSDDFIIGKGSVVATTEYLTFLNDSFEIVVGDASESDVGFRFDGNAQDYFIGIDDDGPDLLKIGLGALADDDQVVTLSSAAFELVEPLLIQPDDTDETTEFLKIAGETDSNMTVLAGRYIGLYREGTLFFSIGYSDTSDFAYAIVSDYNNGNDKAGPTIGVGRNSSTGNEGGAAGTLNLTDADGTTYFLWVDANGDLRIHTSAPTGDAGSPTVSDTAGTIVGTQS